MTLLGNCHLLEHLTIQRVATLGSVPEEGFSLPPRTAAGTLSALKISKVAYLYRSYPWFFLVSIAYPEHTEIGLLSHLDWPIPHEVKSDSLRQTITRVTYLSLFFIYREHFTAPHMCDFTVLSDCFDSKRKGVLSVG